MIDFVALGIEQSRIDSERTLAERNRLGQFATPFPLALEIAEAVTEHVHTPPRRFLEPSLGLGTFYAAYRQVFGTDGQARGVELDSRMVRSAQELWSGTGLNVVEADFTRLAPPPTKDRYDLILANPPYVRHHHLDTVEKARLQALVRERLGIDVSGLAGLYVPFLLLADAWLAEGGFAAWLIPSEFLDVNYGSALRIYLSKHVTTLRIHRFLASDTQFGDALVTSTVVIFTKQPVRPGPVRLTVGGSLAHPESEVLREREHLNAAKKWSSSNPSTSAQPQKTTLGDFFTIRRGIATGANAFFILDRRLALTRGIPETVLRPILPSARYLNSDVIAASHDGYPLIDHPLALLDCRMGLGQVEDSGLRDYLEEGRSQAIDRGYLTSRRTPWYLQEQRAVPLFLCTYMGRGRAGGKPFRFLWNQSQAIAANTYLLLSPRPGLQQRIAQSPSLPQRIFQWFQSLSSETLKQQGRVYGGGLHKIEPKELAGLPADGLAQVLG